MTAFKRALRLHQAHWRESRGLPIGSQPVRPTEDDPGVPLGSRIEADYAKESGSNFLTDEAAACARIRVDSPQPNETLWVDRLYADLLSSMPMCFNLFGPVACDTAKLEAFVAEVWPEIDARPTALGFEWSPGRQVPGRFLENRSAFDSVIHLEMSGGSRGVIGIETKYHEDCRAERVPSDQRLRRYRQVADESGVFLDGAVDRIVGTPLQQIWLDHLLALSMLQDTEEEWGFVSFVLVHPSGNTSFEQAAAEYRQLLSDDSTFECRTTEELVRAESYPDEAGELFRNRYEPTAGAGWV
jgi:hypothetical protein